MDFSFNLIDEPWIPCLRPDGTQVDMGLRDALARAHSLQEIRGDTPLETAALHRLILAILHRVLGPRKIGAWARLWELSRFDMSALNEYLFGDQIHPRFDLFHPQRPFYQSRDPRAPEKSIISLVPQMASGNNATLFDHHTELESLPLTPAQAARSLVVSQAFGIGGLSGMPEKFTDAPCAKGIIFLAFGDNLFETLMLNLLRYTGSDPIPNSDDDRPAWEMADPFQPDRNHPLGYLDYLTWQNRRVWLFPERIGEEVVVRRMCWSPGLRLHRDDIDPMKQYLQDKKLGPHPLLFGIDRALWRDSATLFRPGDSTKAPQVVMWIADLASSKRGKILAHDRSFRLMALGMAKDQASVDFLRGEALPLPVSLLDNEDYLGILSSALESAEKAGSVLRLATFTLARLILDPALKDQDLETRPRKEANERIQRLAGPWGSERCYWSGLEPTFYRFIRDLPLDPQAALSKWRDQLRRAANAAFDQAESYAGLDRRALRAIVQARGRFESQLRHVLHEPNDAVSQHGGEKE
jgi:CRISPR system Cascade subunit CasA